MMPQKYSFCERIRRCRSNPNDSKLHLSLRFGIVMCFFTVLIVMKFTGALSFTSPECIEDKFVALTTDMNEYLAENQSVLKSLIIVCSLNIDITLISYAFCFVYYYRSWRLTIWAGFFYPIRSVIQSFFGMRIPVSYEWRYPGFPSLFVPYSEGDFFYSGHAGLMLALAFEFYHYKFYWACVLVSLLNVYNCILLVVTRSHYSIDIVGGLVFSHYFYLLAGHICKALERIGVFQASKMNKIQHDDEIIARSNIDELPLFSHTDPTAPVEENIKSQPNSYEGSLKQKLIPADD